MPAILRKTARKRLLDAGLRLFAEQGYAATSVRQLVLEADCGLSSISHHFGDKAGLFAALAQELSRKLWERRSAALESLDPSDAGLRQLLGAFFGPGFHLMAESEDGLRWALLAGRAATDWSEWTRNVEATDPALEHFLGRLAAVTPHFDDRERAARLHAVWLLADGLKTDRLIPPALRRRGLRSGADDPGAALERFLELACVLFGPSDDGLAPPATQSREAR